MRIAARHFYRRAVAVLSGVSVRGLSREKLCNWHAGNTAVQNQWVVLHRCCEDFTDIQQVMDRTLCRGSPCVSGTTSGSTANGSSSSGAPGPVEYVKGYGYLLTFQVPAGQGVPEVIHLINQGLSRDAFCAEYAKLDCNKIVFDDAVRWARHLAQDLTFPLVNVSMEQSDKSKDPCTSSSA